MFIKKLILNYFQKHDYLELNFIDGVNIVSGKTDSGKSCIVRAIKWVFFGEPKGDVVRKEGTKKTSVEVTLDDGTIIEKIKSTSVNAYILKVGEEVKRFDAVGKTIPEEILKVLKSRTIRINNEEIIFNIADQISLPFLLDKSGSFRMKLFNQLTGNDIIDKVFQGLNRDILHIGKEERIEKEHLEEQEKNLKELIEKKKKVEKVYNLFIIPYNKLKEKLSTYEKVNDYSQELNTINKGLGKLKLQLNGIHTIKENKLLNLDQKIERLEYLNELLYKIKIIKKELLNIEEQLKKTLIPKLNIKILREKIEKLVKYQKFITQLNDIITTDNILITKIDNATKQIKIDVEKYKLLLKESGICPTCKTKVTDDIIKEIKL